MAGSDTNVCQYAAKPKDVVEPILVKVSKLESSCKVLAKLLQSCCKVVAKQLVICIPEGYEHSKEGEINVAEFGQKSVILTWNWKYNHDEKDLALFDKCPMTVSDDKQNEEDSRASRL